MANPWLKKNPFMSMFLSGANSLAGSARAQATAAVKRQTTKAVTEAGAEMFKMWTGAAAGPKAVKRTKRRR